MVWATMDGLARLVTLEGVAKQRGADPSELDYKPRQETTHA